MIAEKLFPLDLIGLLQIIIMSFFEKKSEDGYFIVYLYTSLRGLYLIVLVQYTRWCLIVKAD